MIVFSIGSHVIIQRLLIIVLIPSFFISMNEKSFERYRPISSIIYHNHNRMESGFPPTSGQIPSTSGSSD